MSIPLLAKCLVHIKSHIRLMLVTLDTLVEHTKFVVGLDEEVWHEQGGRTSHPICMAICKTIVELVLDTEYDEGDNIDQI